MDPGSNLRAPVTRRPGTAAAAARGAGAGGAGRRRPPTRRSSYAERLRQVADAMAAEIAHWAYLRRPRGRAQGRRPQHARHLRLTPSPLGNLRCLFDFPNFCVGFADGHDNLSIRFSIPSTD